MQYTKLTIFSIGFLITFNLHAQDAAIVKFKEIDVDDNGVITIREMQSFYKDKKDKKDNPIDAKKRFYALNHDKNSIISLDEYLKGVDWKLARENVDKWQYKPKPKSEKDKKIETSAKAAKKGKTFERIDSDGNGIVTRSEMIDFYKGRVNKKTNKPVDGKRIFYAHDHNEDSEVTRDEFIRIPNGKRATELMKKEKKDKVDSEDKAYDFSQEEELNNDNSEEEIQRQFTIFDNADVDNNYNLSIEEFDKIYEGKTNKNGKPINIEMLFYGIDTNDDNAIDLVEFTAKIDWEYAKKKYKEKRKEARIGG
jgi:Ca2+-binding EF-hand superfamily protein